MCVCDHVSFIKEMIDTNNYLLYSYCFFKNGGNVVLKRLSHLLNNKHALFSLTILILPHSYHPFNIFSQWVYDLGIIQTVKK